MNLIKLLFLTCLLLIIGCKSEKTPLLNGILTGINNQNIVLEKWSPIDKGFIPVDTTKTDENGNYMFSNSENELGLYKLNTNSGSADFIINGKGTLSISSRERDGKQIFTMNESNRPYSKLFNKIQEYKTLDDSLDNVYRKAINQNSQYTIHDDYKRQKKKIRMKLQGFCMKYIDKNLQDISIIQAASFFPIKEIGRDYYAKVASSLQTNYPNNENAKEFIEWTEKKNHLYEKPAMDFELPNVSNEKVKLSELKGKVTILSFWTVESSVSEKYMIDINTLAIKYPEAQFVNVNLDKTPNLWKELVTNEKLKGINVYAEGGIYSSVATNYKIELPINQSKNFIIDKQGKVINKSLKPFEIDEFLSQIF